MSNPTDESINVVPKKKKGRTITKPYKKPSPTDKRLKANREPTAAEAATRFQAGHTLMKNQRENRIKKVRQYRAKLFCITDAMVPMLADLAYDAYEAGDAKTVLEIFKAITPFAVGRAPEMETDEETTPDTNIHNTNIVITTDQFKAAVQSDNDYVQVIDSSDFNSQDDGEYE